MVIYDCDMQASVAGGPNSEIIQISKTQSSTPHNNVNNHTDTHTYVCSALYIRGMFQLEDITNYMMMVLQISKKLAKGNANQSVFPSFSATVWEYSQQGVRRLHN